MKHIMTTERVIVILGVGKDGELVGKAVSHRRMKSIGYMLRVLNHCLPGCTILSGTGVR